MGKWRDATMAALFLAGCSVTTQSSAAGPVNAAGRRLGAVESISFEIRSWGYPVEGFRIASDGSGEYRKAPEFRADVRITRFSAGRAGFARIRAALEGVERYTSNAPPCGDRMTDFPYGEIVWQTGAGRASVNFDLGCRSPEMQRVAERAHQATRLAEEFARTNPSP